MTERAFASDPTEDDWLGDSLSLFSIPTVCDKRIDAKSKRSGEASIRANNQTKTQPSRRNFFGSPRRTNTEIGGIPSRPPSIRGGPRKNTGLCL